MVRKPGPFSVDYIYSLTIRDAEAMIRASILEVQVGTLKSALLSSSTQIGELGSQRASKIP